MKRAHAESPSACIRVLIDELCCPITHQLMIRPAVAADGHTYERAAIRKWLLSSKMNSPMTNEALENRVLRANHALRRICDAALARAPAAGRAEAEEVASLAAVLDERQLDRLCANVAACEPHRMCARRWSFAMDGDSPEDVARMLVASMQGGRKNDQAHAGLVALQRVATVSRAEAIAAGAARCALECLTRAEGDRNVEAALSLIAIVGGGDHPNDALDAVRRELRRPSGLTALVALLPGCDQAQLQGCVEGLIDSLASAVPALVSAAMRPAAVLAMAGSASDRMRDAMAAAMLRFHSDDGVQVATLRALREQAEHVPEYRRNLELLGFSLATQLMRAQTANARAVRDAAAALCSVLGVMAVAVAPLPPSLLILQDDVDSESGEVGSDDDLEGSSAEWDEWED